MSDSSLDPNREPRRFPAFLAAPVRAGLMMLAADERYTNDWQPGRQDSGYDKLDLRHCTLSERDDKLLTPLLAMIRGSFLVDVSQDQWDAYILRFPDGSSLPDHRDPVAKDARHLRFNGLIQTPDTDTGVLRFNDTVFELSAGDAVCFRPDQITHRLSPVRGNRLVLSVGCVY